MYTPQYTVQQMLDGLKDSNMGWHYQNQPQEEYFFGGEAYEVLTSNHPIPESEVKGLLKETTFISKDGKFKATIAFRVGKIEALAVSCVDGVVIIPKLPILYLQEKKVEGYWFSEYSPQYPLPIKNQLSTKEAKEIFDLIQLKEKEANKFLTRGSSISRIDQSVLGSGEFHHNYWLWPEDFAAHYVLKYRVKPSPAFLEFIGWKPSN